MKEEDGHMHSNVTKVKKEKVDEKAKAREKRTALRSRMENRFLLMMRMRLIWCVSERARISHLSSTILWCSTLVFIVIYIAPSSGIYTT
jgi:hypothetical protein